MKDPDGQRTEAFYGPLVSNAAGLSSQQGSPSTYGYGYPVLSTDEAGKTKQVWRDGFGRIIEVDEPALGDTQSSGSVTISGSEQSIVTQTCILENGNGDCIRWKYNVRYDNGSVSITVNGHQDSTSYGSASTDASIASALASAFNSDQNSPVTASLSATTISLVSKASGTGTNYTLSAGSSTNDPGYFGGPSFFATASGDTLESDLATGSLSSPVSPFYIYNAADRLTQVAQGVGVQARNFAYDGLGRPSSVQTPEAGTDSYSYTASGGGLCSGDPSNVCQRTDARGVITTYFYSQDALNRLVGQSYQIPQGSKIAAMPNGCTTSAGASASVCCFYDQGGAQADALGRRTEMVDPSGSESYQYDAGGRLTQLTKVAGSPAQSYTIPYQYDVADEVTQITYPSRRVLSPSYDAFGRLAKLADTSATYLTIPASDGGTNGFNAPGQLLNAIFGNGVGASFGYSANRSQLSCLDYSTSSRSGSCTHDSTSLFGLSYFYQFDSSNCAVGTPGDDGQIQCITDSVQPGRTLAITYDALARLNNAATQGSTSFPAWGLAMSYDRYDNRMNQRIASGCVAPMTCPTNSLSFANPGGAQTNHPDGWWFDLSGNLLAKIPTPACAPTCSPTCSPACPAQTYFYDGENRLVQIGGTVNQCSTTANACHTYEGAGMRVQKTIPNGVTTVFLWSGSRDIAEYDNGAAPASPSRVRSAAHHWRS